MKKQYDFSKGERGKFFRPDVELNIPVYLEPQIAEAVREHATKRNTNIGKLVNEWLRKDLRSERQRSKRAVRAAHPEGPRDRSRRRYEEEG